MNTRSLVCFVMALSPLSACAITNHTIQRAYRPPSNSRARATSPRSLVWERLELVPTLHRDQQAVGVKKNGYGHETALIYTSPPPHHWLAAAARAQFRSAGVSLDGKGRGLPRVAIVVEQFFVEPDVGFWGARVTAVTMLDLRVTFPRSRRSFRRRFVGEKTEFEITCLDNDYERHLVESAQIALQQAAQQTRALIERMEG